MSFPESVWRKVILPPSGNVKDAIANLNETGRQIVLVCDGRGGRWGCSQGPLRRGDEAEARGALELQRIG